MMVVLLTACFSTPPTTGTGTGAQAAPPASEAEAFAPVAGAKVFDLDLPGGHGGAPAGSSFHLPPGAVVETFAGDLGDGTLGLRLGARAEGDALACTERMAVGASGALVVRLRVPELVAGGVAWHGLDLEMRARDAGGALVSPEGSRYVVLQRWREPVGQWTELTAPFATPAGAVTGEFCFRFVKSTGVVEVDRVQVLGESPAGAPAATAPAADATPGAPDGGALGRWDLDEAGPIGAPPGTTFVLPAEAAASSLRVDALEGGATGVRIEVPSPGNALLCTEPFAAAPTLRARARVRTAAVAGPGKAGTGFVAEARCFDPSGTLAPGPVGPYLRLGEWTEPTAWVELDAEIQPPPTAATAKLCFRFVDATGVAEVDWIEVR